MSKYKRQPSFEEVRDDMIERGELDADGNPIEPKEVKDDKPSKPDHDWKQRYDDSRRFIQELQTKLKSVEGTLEAVSKEKEEALNRVPTNEKEFEEWLAKYPKLAEMIGILARKEGEKLVKSVGDEQKKVIEDLNNLKLEREVEEAKAKLRKLQPDFYTDIAPSQEFHDWLENEASDWAKKAILNPDRPDAQLASDVIDLYKMRRTAKTNAPKTTDVLDIASSSRGSTPSPKGTTKVKWSESIVHRLSDKEYAKYEEEIHDAMAKGEFDYDMSKAS